VVCAPQAVSVAQARKKNDGFAVEEGKMGKERTIPNQHPAAGHFVGCCRLPPRRKLKVPLCWMEVDRDRIGSVEANRSGMDAVAGAGKCGGSALIVEREILCVVVFNCSR
jgi:hypothetical protein